MLPNNKGAVQYCKYLQRVKVYTFLDNTNIIHFW
jgi:hypothetical protein